MTTLCGVSFSADSFLSAEMVKSKYEYFGGMKLTARCHANFIPQSEISPLKRFHPPVRVDFVFVVPIDPRLWQGDF